MLQDVSEERDGVAFILVFKLSRFGRNAADVLNSLQFIQDYGVNLICVEDGIDSSKDSGKLTITVLSAVDGREGGGRAKEAWKGRGDDGVLVVPRAGELLYRVRATPPTADPLTWQREER